MSKCTLEQLSAESHLSHPYFPLPSAHQDRYQSFSVLLDVHLNTHPGMALNKEEQEGKG